MIEGGYVLDIETTTDHKTIRQVGILDIDTGLNTLHLDRDAFCDWWVAHIRKNTPVVTWNGARFDLPRLEELWDMGNLTNACTHIDGMILAKMVKPDDHKYSLDWWAYKFGYDGKLDVVTDIDWYNTCSGAELWEYLKQDLRTTHLVVATLVESIDPKQIAAVQRAISLEVRVARECQRQVEKGICFDVYSAAKLKHCLTEHMEELEKEIDAYLPQVPISESNLDYPPKVQFKKDGELSAAMLRWMERNDLTLSADRKSVGCHSSYYIATLPAEFPVNYDEKAKLSNLAPIKDYLLTLGWEPTEWNFNSKGKRTGPRLTLKGTNDVCPDLDRIGAKWVKMLSEWLTIRSRRNVLASPNLTGWLPLAIENGGFLGSDADTMGANTARWTHKVVANVPRVTSMYGREMRQLFQARSGKWWVGWDASSLEACCEAHYTYPYDKAYADELMDGDIHTKNLHAIDELRDRGHAKTFKYGITYGAQVKRVAKILGCDVVQAQLAFDAFWDNNFALKSLKSDLQRKVKMNAADGNGKVFRAIDGRFIQTRSEHSQLNALFQSCGAIVMKYAMLIADRAIRREFSEEEAYGLIRYHDEEMWECSTKSIADRVGQLGVESIRLAGEYLKLNVPLTGEYKVGKNWAECH